MLSSFSSCRPGTVVGRGSQVSEVWSATMLSQKGASEYLLTCKPTTGFAQSCAGGPGRVTCAPESRFLWRVPTWILSVCDFSSHPHGSLPILGFTPSLIPGGSQSQPPSGLAGAQRWTSKPEPVFCWFVLLGEAQGSRLHPEVTRTCSTLPPFRDRRRQRHTERARESTLSLQSISSRVKSLRNAHETSKDKDSQLLGIQ